jgi:AraC family transcriptional regulator
MSTQILEGVPVHRICLAEPPTIIGIGPGLHHPGLPHVWRMAGWCLHLYGYEADLIMAGQALPIRPGFASVAPPRIELDYRFRGPSQHISVHFSAAAGPARWAVGAMIDLQPRYAEIERALYAASSWQAADPLRARVRLWDILLGLARPAAGGHPLVEAARGLIEQRLAQAIEVQALARELGCSHNHLTGLFRRELGSTVVGWIRRRRAQLAHHLLISTSLPLAAIAREVGIPDPHHFNKVIRRELGAAPRRLRQRGQ